MILTSAGNVGIGTTSPIGMLSVVNPISNTNTWTPTNNPDLWVSNAGTSNSYYPFGVTTNSGDIFSITNAGNVGIGTTSPSVNLDIEDASGVTIDINSSSGDGQFRFQDAGTTKWAVGRDNTQQNFVFSNSTGLSSGNVLTLEHATGNVGIGTTSPAHALDVVGYIRSGNTGADNTSKYISF